MIIITSMNLTTIIDSGAASFNTPSFPFNDYIKFSRESLTTFQTHLRELQPYEATSRRSVDIMESIENGERHSLKMHFVNGEDPTFKVRFSELPELIVDVFIKSDIDPTLYSISDEPHTTMSFYDALMTACQSDWLKIVDARKDDYLNELKETIWRDLVSNRYHSKRNYGALFSYDEMQRCLKHSPSQDMTTAAIITVQDFFKINLIIIYEEDGQIRFHKTTMCRAFDPYVILIVREGLTRAIVKKDGQPSFFRYSSHMILLQTLLKNGLPPNTQKLGLNLKPLKIAKLREISEAIGIPCTTNGKKLTKDQLLNCVEAHKFTDDEIEAVKDCLC